MRGTLKYQLIDAEESQSHTAHLELHYDARSLQMIYDPSGLYRTSQGIFFGWYDFAYTAILGYWPEGAQFHLLPMCSHDNEERYIEIRNGIVTDMETGERCFLNYGGFQWEYAKVAARLWHKLRFE